MKYQFKSYITMSVLFICGFLAGSIYHSNTEINSDRDDEIVHPIVHRPIDNEIERSIIRHAERSEYLSSDKVLADVISVYDGDTFTVNIANWPSVVGDKIPVRIRGVDTPEVTDGNIEIKTFALFVRDQLKLKLSGREVELTNIQRDKYFRLLCDVLVNGENVSDWLISSKYAFPYDGGTKRRWTISDIR